MLQIKANERQLAQLWVLFANKDRIRRELPRQWITIQTLLDTKLEISTVMITDIVTNRE